MRWLKKKKKSILASKICSKMLRFTVPSSLWIILNLDCWFSIAGGLGTFSSEEKKIIYFILNVKKHSSGVLFNNRSPNSLRIPTNNPCPPFFFSLTHCSLFAKFGLSTIHFYWKRFKYFKSRVNLDGDGHSFVSDSKSVVSEILEYNW